MRKPLLLGILVGLALTVSAQNSSNARSFVSTTLVRPLVTQPINERNLLVLKGNLHPLARPQFDVGGAPPNLALERMLLVLKRSPEEDVALKTLLDQQQDKSSPNFHRWLTPDEFGAAFGPADADIQAVTGWLQTHGFQVNRVARGRTMIEFSGSHAQLQQAFHTSIHQYAVNGELHWANSSDPQIPAALAPVVAGVHTLHNFQKKPMLVRTNQQFAVTQNPGSTPTVTGTGGQHFLAPGDFNKIYNVPATLTGLGATIAVVGRSNINMQDVSDFQSIFFGVPKNVPTVVLNGQDPGNLGSGGGPAGQNEEAEALLDNTWSSSLAPSASVKFVVSATTDVTDGVDLSELYIIDNNLADIMTESFGICEAAFTNTQAQGVELLAEQAAAQGITYTLSTGDTGSAGCARGGTLGTTSISVLAATRFNVAVGGTQFNDTANPAKYWNPSQSALVTALSYIPENVWNESSGTSLAATGGGASAIFPKPSWQTGVTANDSARDIPDVSLAAAGHTPYLICFEGSCGQQFLAGIAGTSASAPSFAAMMALIIEKTGTRQGQADYVLYKLAATQSSLTTCNGSSTTTLPASNCIFNDVTSGTNAVAGVAGFTAAKGYDRATGLGSVNVTNLANAWATAEGSFKGSATTLSLTPTPASITHGQPVNVQIGVAPSGGATGTPSGDVALLQNGPTGVSIQPFSLAAGAATGSTQLLPGGSYNVIAHYSGDGTFGSSDSAPVAVTVLPEGSSVLASAQTFDSVGNLINLAGGSTAYGNPIYLKADVQGTAGIATGTVNFVDGGTTTLANATLNSQGDANTAQGLFAVPAGSHSVVAKYLGDASFNASNSAALAFTVTKATTTASVQPSAASVNVGGTVDLFATVSTTSGGNAPGGTVTFFSGATQLGSPVPVATQTSGSGSIQTGAFTAASATFNLIGASPAAGKNNITAVFNGDGNYSASTSPIAVVNVADFTLSGAPGSVTISAPGKTGSLTLTVTGVQSNFAGSVSFAPASCSGLPSLATCSFSTASVVNGGTTVLTITTTAPQSAALFGGTGRMGLWATSLGGLFGALFLVGAPTRRRSSKALSLIAFALCLGIVACGGSKSSPPPVTKPGTPTGTFNVVVTGTSTSGATNSLPFTLLVQ